MVRKEAVIQGYLSVTHSWIPSSWTRVGRNWSAVSTTLLVRRTNPGCNHDWDTPHKTPVAFRMDCLTGASPGLAGRRRSVADRNHRGHGPGPVGSGNTRRPSSSG